MKCPLRLLLLLLIFESAGLRAELPARGVLEETEGRVLYSEPPAREVEVKAGQTIRLGGRLRTLEKSRAVVRWSDSTLLRMKELTSIELHKPAATNQSSLVNLLHGALYFFSRVVRRDVGINTRYVTAGARGTEYEIVVEVDRTVVRMFDGIAELTNSFGRLELTNSQVAEARGNLAPRPIGFVATNVVQWWLFYPSVLDTNELRLAPPDAFALSKSLRAYGSGDLHQALADYPTNRVAASAAEKVYFASLGLGVGRIQEATNLLASVAQLPDATDSVTSLAAAVLKLIAAVTAQPAPAALNPRISTNSASQQLAESYVQQAQAKLPEALLAARHAVSNSTNFAFGWARVAELEFSFGQLGEAERALDRSLLLGPRNAQALTLKGFMLAARNQTAAAMTWFDQAIEVDGALGNAWLGRGLCRIRQGKKGSLAAGRADLQTAAALEANRSFLRSYLGKAWSEAGDDTLAARELALARRLDQHDPTPWLYAALMDRAENRINRAVDELERSIALNDNRAVYRSRFLLDQDRAVRSANLAATYREAGLTDVSLRQALKAVNTDYANYSAHLFLANSYGEILNYTPQVNLRYETARVSEYLVATLLAPVGAGVLSPTVSQQEYSRLFEQDRLGGTSSTEFRSRGAWTESAAQYGTFRNSSYAVDTYYQNDPGQRANNDLELFSFSARVKQQVTPSDTIFLQAITSEGRFGDLAQYYDPLDPTRGANRFVRSKETQEPILLAGYHHEWSPESHTLLLVGRLQDTLQVKDPLQGTLVVRRPETNAPVASVLPYPARQNYRSDLEIYTAEVQQIFQGEPGALVLGSRQQGGRFDTRNLSRIPANFTNCADRIIPSAAFDNPLQDVSSDLERMSYYAYAHWQALDPLRLVGGVAYDRLKYPANFRYGPVADQIDTTDQISPKAGVIFSPFSNTVLRSAYSRSLGGASLEQSFGLEPSQVAGFNQAWRSIIPESVTGANAAEHFENWGISLEQRFATRTYLAAEGVWLKSKLNRLVGVFDGGPPQIGVFPTPPYIFQSGTRQRLDFNERIVTVSLNQLAGDEWAFGACYQFSCAELDDAFQDIPASVGGCGGFRQREQLGAALHQVNLLAIYNHPSGFFAQFDSLWTRQSSRGFVPVLPGDDFWQFNFSVGYRFPRRHAEVRLGVLNLAGRDYRLNPLNLTSELPRERTLVTTVRFSF